MFIASGLERERIYAWKKVKMKSGGNTHTLKKKHDLPSAVTGSRKYRNPMGIIWQGVDKKTVKDDCGYLS